MSCKFYLILCGVILGLTIQGDFTHAQQAQTHTSPQNKPPTKPCKCPKITSGELYELCWGNKSISGLHTEGMKTLKALNCSNTKYTLKQITRVQNSGNARLLNDSERESIIKTSGDGESGTWGSSGWWHACTYDFKVKSSMRRQQKKSVTFAVRDCVVETTKPGETGHRERALDKK